MRSEVSSPLSYCEVALDIPLLSHFLSISKMIFTSEEESVETGFQKGPPGASLLDPFMSAALLLMWIPKVSNFRDF